MATSDSRLSEYPENAVQANSFGRVYFFCILIVSSVYVRLSMIVSKRGVLTEVSPTFQRIGLQFKASLENVTNLRPDGEDFRWYFMVSTLFSLISKTHTWLQTRVANTIRVLSSLFSKDFSSCCICLSCNTVKENSLWCQKLFFNSKRFCQATEGMVLKVGLRCQICRRDWNFVWKNWGSDSSLFSSKQLKHIQDTHFLHLSM